MLPALGPPKPKLQIPMSSSKSQEPLHKMLSYKMHPLRRAPAIPLPPVYAHDMGEGKRKATLHFACNEQRKQKMSSHICQILP